LSNGSGELRRVPGERRRGAPVVNALVGAVHGIDSQQPVSSVETLEQVRGAQLADHA